MESNHLFQSVMKSKKGLFVVLFALSFIFMSISDISSACFSGGGTAAYYAMNFIMNAFLFSMLIFAFIFEKKILARGVLGILSGFMIATVWTSFGAVFTNYALLSVANLFRFVYVASLATIFIFYVLEKINFNPRYALVVDILTYVLLISSFTAFILFSILSAITWQYYTFCLLMLSYFFYALGLFFFLNSFFKSKVHIDNIKESIRKAKKAFKDLFKEKADTSNSQSSSDSYHTSDDDSVSQGKVKETIIDAKVEDHKE